MVLIVENEQALPALTLRMLEDLPYQVLSTADLNEGIAQVRQHGVQIALQITDTVMPE